MCGRYTLATTPPQLRVRFNIQGELPDLPPRYNVAPQTVLPVVVCHSSNRLELMRWGFLPRWAEDPKAVKQPINARSETAALRPLFRHAFRYQRCIVPASGFYEWQQTERGSNRTTSRCAQASCSAHGCLSDANYPWRKFRLQSHNGAWNRPCRCYGVTP